MPRFHVRVVLHNAQAEHYEKLHETMAEQGFSITITSSDGIEYHLPDAEYRIEATLTLEQVGERTKHAAGLLRKRFAYVANQVTGARIYGLERVERDG